MLLVVLHCVYCYGLVADKGSGGGGALLGVAILVGSIANTSVSVSNTDVEGNTAGGKEAVVFSSMCGRP